MVVRWGLTLGLLVLIGLVQAGLWQGDGGLAHVRRLQAELADAQQRNAEQRRGNASLQAEVEDLKAGLEMVEERARIELGMVKADEVFVQYAPPAAAVGTPGAPATTTR